MQHQLHTVHWRGRSGATCVTVGEQLEVCMKMYCKQAQAFLWQYDVCE